MRRLTLLVVLFLGVELPGAAPLSRTVLVFPFENLSGRADLNWISESFAETLTVRLESAERAALRRQERNAAYAEMGLPAGVPLTLASSYRVARVLGADWAVVGNFDVMNDVLRLRGQLLDVAQMRLSAPIEIAGALEDLVELQTLLAWRLLGAHDPELAAESEEEFQARFPEERLDAYENYIRGLLAPDGGARVHHLTEAVRLNPSDRRAAMELGRHYFAERDYENSARWLRRIRPGDPDYYEALFFLGVDEYFLGRLHQAEKALRELVREVPLSEAWNNLGLIEARRGRYAEAVEAFFRAFEGDPEDPEFAFNLAAGLERLNRHEEAERYFEEAARLASQDREEHAWLEEAVGSQQSVRGASVAAPDPAKDSPDDLLYHLRLKKDFNGRAFRLLSLAAGRDREGGNTGEPGSSAAPPAVDRLRGGLTGERGKP